MTANTTAIDRLLAPARRIPRPWAAVGLGAVTLGGFYVLNANRNLLYLSMLFSAAVMMSVVLRRWWTIVLGLGICAFLAGVPARVADLGPLYPAPRDRPGTENMWVSAIKQGETWVYRFAPGDLGIAGGAGPAGILYIDGRNLSGLVVDVQGRTVNASAFCGKKNGFDHVAIPLAGEGTSAFTVSLRGMPRTTPKIYHGPEAHGFEVYGDAVWLEFTGDRGRIICEAQRTVVASGPR